MYTKLFKRILDLVFASTFLIVLSPLIILIYVVLFVSNNGKPFFIQKRPGKNEKIFEVIKFKTMNDKRDTNGELLTDARRLTKVGAFIRKTSFDEIPQLLNVVKGEMSLIGPRPLLPEYLSMYNKSQKKRHNVKPGITGWAQVNGRNAISWNKKFEYDIWYVENLSFLLDLKIIIKTVIKVLRSEGINTENQATTVKFKGNE